MCDNGIWKMLKKFNDEHFPGWRKTPLVYYSNALAGEVGEVCNLTKKLTGRGTKQEPIEDGKLIEEIADVEIYKILLLLRMGYSEQDFITAVLRKNRKNIHRMLGKKGSIDLQER